MGTLSRILSAVVESVLSRSPFEVWDLSIEIDPDELLADLTHNQS